MKKLIIIIIMISSCNVFSQLEIPELIDLGDIYLSRVDYSDTVGLKFEQYSYRNINLKNYSDKEFYIFDIHHESMNNQPRFYNATIGRKIRIFDSLELIVGLTFPYQYINNLIDTTFILKSWLLYRNVKEMSIDSLEMTIKFTTKEASGYYYQAENNDIYPFADLNKPTQEVKYVIGGTVNYLEEFNIDSIKYSSDINTIISVGILKGGYYRALPLSQKTKEYVGFIVLMEISEYKDTKIDLEIYGRHIKQSTDVKYTLSYIFRPRLYTNHIQFNTWYLNYTHLSRFRDSKDVELVLPKMANYTPHQYTIKDIEFIADHPEFVIKDYKNPPIELPKIQDSKIFYTNVDLGRIFISTPNQEEFENNVLIIFHLEDENGYKQDESLYLKYYIDPLLSISDEEEIKDVMVFPNPATDYITINIGSIGAGSNENNIWASPNASIEIYDVMGVLVAQTSSSVFNGQTGTSDPPRIDISNLSPGVYFVKIVGSNGCCSIVEKFVKY